MIEDAKSMLHIATGAIVISRAIYACQYVARKIHQLSHGFVSYKQSDRTTK